MFNILLREYCYQIEWRQQVGIYSSSKLDMASASTFIDLGKALSSKTTPRFYLNDVVEMPEVVAVSATNQDLNEVQQELNEMLGVELITLDQMASKLLDGLVLGKSYVIKPVYATALGTGVLIIKPDRSGDILVTTLPYSIHDYTKDPIFTPWHVFLEKVSSKKSHQPSQIRYTINSSDLLGLLFNCRVDDNKSPYIIVEEYIQNRILTIGQRTMELRFEFNVHYMANPVVRASEIKIGANENYGTITFQEHAGAYGISGQDNILEFLEDNIKGYDHSMVELQVRAIVNKYFKLMQQIGFFIATDVFKFTFDFCFAKKNGKIVPVLIENHILIAVSEEQ